MRCVLAYFLLGIHPVDPAIHERYTRPMQKSQNAHRNVRAVVGCLGVRCGTESAWRIPFERNCRRKSNRFWEHVFILIMFLPMI